MLTNVNQENAVPTTLEPQNENRDLEQRVTNYLATRYLPRLRSLKVKAIGGVVTIHGRVSSFHEKQVAIHSCRRVAGVRQLIDEVSVA